MLNFSNYVFLTCPLNLSVLQPTPPDVHVPQTSPVDKNSPILSQDLGIYVTFSALLLITHV